MPAVQGRSSAAHLTSAMRKATECSPEVSSLGKVGGHTLAVRLSTVSVREQAIILRLPLLMRSADGAAGLGLCPAWFSSDLSEAAGDDRTCDDMLLSKGVDSRSMLVGSAMPLLRIRKFLAARAGCCPKCLSCCNWMLLITDEVTTMLFSRKAGKDSPLAA